jgi:hypothetical protein
MSFDKIISIPGLPGLFRMVAQMRNGGFVVESLADGRRQPVSSMQRIIMLKDIAVYTVEEDIPLYDVFKRMKEKEDLALSVAPKAEPDELKNTLKQIVPEFDEERVHASDIRKIFVWYRQVKDVVGTPEADAAMNPQQENETASLSSEAKAETEGTATAEAAPKKSARKKKELSEPVAADADTEAAPKKKTTRKSTKEKEA